MNNLFLFLFLVSLLGIPICLILAIVNFLRRKRVKPYLASCGISLVIMTVSFIGFGFTTNNVESSNSTHTVASTEMEKSTEVQKPTNIEESNKVESSSETPSEPETTSAPSDKDIFIESLTSNPDVLPVAADDAYRILKDELGFESITVRENLSGTLFELSADDYNLKITISDKLHMVICGDYNMYKDDTVQYTKQDLMDRSIGNNDTYYYVIAQEIVTNNLKAPSTAQFCSRGDCQMARNKEYVAVKGYVDAQNSFGAMLRSEFLVEFKVIDLSSFSYEVVYLNIDGTEAGEFIDLN